MAKRKRKDARTVSPSDDARLPDEPGSVLIEFQKKRVTVRRQSSVVVVIGERQTKQTVLDPTDDTLAKKRARWRAMVELHGGKLSALKFWASDVFGNALPGRDILLEKHRDQFGNIRGITEKTIRLLRRDLVAASPEGSPLRRSTRGGAPTHKARQT